MEPISILIVDDHAMVRRGLKSFLQSEEDIEVIGEATDGLEAVEKVQNLVPDVVLMDLVMPGIDGIEAPRRIKAASPGSKVLILTSFGEDERVFASIKAGATGYLLKDVPAEDLGRAIRSVANGEFLLHPQIARKVLEEFSPLQSKDPLQTELTPREMDVLGLIARGMKNKEIALDLGISIKTVKTHVSNILSKLHMFDRTQAALFAVQHGLIPSPNDGTQEKS
jgi:NarL family two-component system response regulator LiaR